MDAAEAARRFVCDASLGGLARWLRAAGYDARWHLTATTEQLLAGATDLGATLLTSDRAVLERRRVREAEPPAFLVPTALRRDAQLALVVSNLKLTLLPARCMACGGELREVAKQAVRHRIPPRTALWLDVYFVCEGCDRLYWKGTHWQRIRARLTAAL